MRIGQFDLTAHFTPEIQLPAGVKAALIERYRLLQAAELAGGLAVQLVGGAVRFQQAFQPQLLTRDFRAAVQAGKETAARLRQLLPRARDAQHRLLQRQVALDGTVDKAIELRIVKGLPPARINGAGRGFRRLLRVHQVVTAGQLRLRRLVIGADGAARQPERQRQQAERSRQRACRDNLHVSVLLRCLRS